MIIVWVLAWGAAGAPAEEAPRRPNVLLILADDMGFSDVGCYGGEIATPNIDALAGGGVRFTQFYNTARCWPTRAALLTGYYPQQIRRDALDGTGSSEVGARPTWAKLLPAILKSAGYRSYHSGKWHLDGEPLDNGFDLAFDELDHNDHFRSGKWPGGQGGDPAYYSTVAVADHAIGFLESHAREHASEPFFSYVAFHSPHFPLQALPEDIARYRDRYLEGWDVVRERRWRKLRDAGIVNCGLAPRDPSFTPRYFDPAVLGRLGSGEVAHAVPWDSLNDVQKHFQATKMAIHAAMVDRMDREIGRILGQVRKMNAWDDTLILFLSDNGADATIMIRGKEHDPAADPGSEGSFLCIGPGWAGASNAPFALHKVWVHEGGISTPLIAHWPRGIAARGELRRDVTHVIDVVPTILELAGMKATPDAGAPPLPGLSLAPAFARDGAVMHDFLYFQHEGNRALRAGDWKIVSTPEHGGAWELYDLSVDRCESVDLAGRRPEKVTELRGVWEKTLAGFRETVKNSPAAPTPPASKPLARPR